MFSFFSTSHKALSNPSLQPSWCVKWNSFTNENNISIIDGKPNFSEQKNLMLIGDVWLTNKLNLLENLGINPQNWQQNDQHLIIYLWQKYGVKCVNKLQGMFAFVICNLETNQLWLVRDRTGSYTLYYTKDGNNNYAIAPRLKTLSNYHARELDLIALRDYLATAFVPGERTLWQNVSKLSSGTILSLPEQTFTRYYHPIVNVQDADKSLQWHSERLRLLLEQIIQEYLPENEAVGVYLSGGLDSSCVTALAAKFHNYPIHTYSIHFGTNCPNELMYSSLVATHCQTKHNILEIAPQQMWDNLPITMSNLDNPIGDPLTVPNYLLAQFAQKDVKIVLNGEGSDPCFGGPKNQPMLLNQLYQSNENLENAYLTSFQKCFLDLPNLLNYDIWEIVKNQPSIFSSNLYFNTEYLNFLMSLNIKYKGIDHIITKVRNLTLSANLEGRSPLFDQRIVEMSLQIPSEYKLIGTIEKAVLKEAVKDLLPLEIIERQKSGMMIPVQLWFRQEWQHKARKLLLNKKANIAPYLNQNLIKDWLEYKGDIWQRYGVKLWLLVSLEIWLQNN